MPTWGEILKELQTTQTPNGRPDYDAVRRKYLKGMADLTGRNTILYATDFLTGSGDPQTVTINLFDVQALMEVVRDLPPPNLDLILHTPGGSPEALESVVRYLRTRFAHIRVFIPLVAMSAGTMWALACDEIVMGSHSQLGPIDPQFALAFGEQIRLAPAQAVLDQFALAQQECAADRGKAVAWATVLRSYGPSLLKECQRAQELSVALVSEWLRSYMFKNESDPKAIAEKVAKSFADYGTHQSHARPIDRDRARSYGVPITNLEDDQDLQEAVLSVHHAAIHTLSGTASTKIVENHLGRAFVVQAQVLRVQQQQPPPGGPGQTPPPPPTQPLNRQQRRQGRR